MPSQSVNQTQQQTSTTHLLSTGSILQRQCLTCGQHTIAGDTCPECEKQQSLLERSSNPSPTIAVPPVPATPLSGFNHDISRVPVRRAFRQSEYDSVSCRGKELLAHELTNVVQQSDDEVFPDQNILRQPEEKTLPTKPLGVQNTLPIKQPTESKGVTSRRGVSFEWPKYLESHKIKDAKPLPKKLRNRLKAYILVSYRKWERKKMYSTPAYKRISEEESIQDEIKTLQSKGYLVVYNHYATKADIISAFNDPKAVFILTIGHGDTPGKIRTTNYEHVSSEDIKIPKGSNLKQVIFENCHLGDDIEKWEKALKVTFWEKVLGGGVTITAWEGKVTTYESTQFNTEGGSGDRQWGSLMTRVKKLETLKNQKGEVYTIEKFKWTLKSQPAILPQEKPLSLTTSPNPSLLSRSEIEEEMTQIDNWLDRHSESTGPYLIRHLIDTKDFLRKYLKSLSKVEILNISRKRIRDYHEDITFTYRLQKVKPSEPLPRNIEIQIFSLEDGSLVYDEQPNGTKVPAKQKIPSKTGIQKWTWNARYQGFSKDFSVRIVDTNINQILASKHFKSDAKCLFGFSSRHCQ